MTKENITMDSTNYSTYILEESPSDSLAWNMFDGNDLSTFWNCLTSPTEDDPSYFIIDLQQTSYLSTIKYKPYGTRYISKLRISTSDDNITWSEAVLLDNCYNSTIDAETVTLSFGCIISCRYLKVEILGLHTGSLYTTSIYEMELYSESISSIGNFMISMVKDKTISKVYSGIIQLIIQDDGYMLINQADGTMVKIGLSDQTKNAISMIDTFSKIFIFDDDNNLIFRETPIKYDYISVGW